MPKKRYVLDLSDLQFRHHRLPWSKKLLNFFMWFGLSIGVAFIYNIIYKKAFDSVKELSLNQDLESIKLKYDILNKKFDDAQNIIIDIKLSDDKRYRPVLKLASLEEKDLQPGIGGVDRVSEFSGYSNADLLIKTKSRIDELKNQVNFQEKSFSEVAKKASDWKTMMEYLPYISPIKGSHLGDRMGRRQKHPVTGAPAWHNGQDFTVSTGTEVFATGAGIVVESGYDRGGFGNYVVIDHGYGYKTTYGHLSRIEVSKGLNVKRGTLVGLSGSTGLSTGPHLHYQIDLFGKHENPLSYFDNNDLTEEEYSEMIENLSTGQYN